MQIKLARIREVEEYLFNISALRSLSNALIPYKVIATNVIRLLKQALDSSPLQLWH